MLPSLAEKFAVDVIGADRLREIVGLGVDNTSRMPTGAVRAIRAVLPSRQIFALLQKIHCPRTSIGNVAGG